MLPTPLGWSLFRGCIRYPVNATWGVLRAEGKLLHRGGGQWIGCARGWNGQG